MFNQLMPSDIVGAVGVTARDAARSDDPAGEWERDQLLSAYSATRHLAVELASYGPVFADFTAQAVAKIRASAPEGDADRLAVAAAIEADGSIANVGAALSDLLASLRDDSSPAAATLRSELHALLRGLADREVDLLADALGG